MRTVKEIVSHGTIEYAHHYCYDSVAYHDIDPPKELVKLAKLMATIISYGDGTLGIDIDGHAWAVENRHSCRPGKQMRHEVWQYIRAALDSEPGGIDIPDQLA